MNFLHLHLWTCPVTTQLVAVGADQSHQTLTSRTGAITVAKAGAADRRVASQTPGLDYAGVAGQARGLAVSIGRFKSQRRPS